MIDVLGAVFLPGVVLLAVGQGGVVSGCGGVDVNFDGVGGRRRVFRRTTGGFDFRRRFHLVFGFDAGFDIGVVFHFDIACCCFFLVLVWQLFFGAGGWDFAAFSFDAAFMRRRRGHD